MICKIHNIECCFMSKRGCGASGSNCCTIIDKCNGCDRVIEYVSTIQELDATQIQELDATQMQTKYCSTCSDPKVSWSRGNCIFATHIVEELTKDGKILNAMKASKRKARGR